MPGPFSIDSSLPLSPDERSRRAPGCSLIDVTGVREALEFRGVPVHLWPEGDEGFSGLIVELSEGTSELRWLPEEQRLFRRIRLVRMHVRTEFDGVTHDLFEDHQICLASSQVRRRWQGKLPSETLERGESPQDGFLRGLREELQMTAREAFRVRVVHSSWRPIIELDNGRSFPGLETQYHIWDFWAQLTCKQARREGYIEERGGRRTFFVWRPETLPGDDSVDVLARSVPG